MIPPYPLEPRYDDVWKNLKAAMCEQMEKEVNEDA